KGYKNRALPSAGGFHAIKHVHKDFDRTNCRQMRWQGARQAGSLVSTFRNMPNGFMRTIIMNNSLMNLDLFQNIARAPLLQPFLVETLAITMFPFP
ncbi:MAG TPA: hypothetical protein PKC15_17215, partial [Rhodocyclaceae bacterium]|nr:hypothetical protein [Rhodocyclaceae bacterium]